ncbi:MAG: GGDEF domain-containing protein, partial [Planctomycetota bacterium]
RVGGEEFLVLCPGQGIEEAAALAERLRVALSASEVEVGEGSVRVTASFGVATRTDDVPDAEALLKAADEASYRAKQGGRDRVERQG